MYFPNDRIPFKNREHSIISLGRGISLILSHESYKKLNISFISWHFIIQYPKERVINTNKKYECVFWQVN